MNLRYVYKSVALAYTPRGWSQDLPGERLLRALIAFFTLIAEFIALVMKPAFSIASCVCVVIAKAVAPIVRILTPPATWVLLKFTSALNLVLGLFAKLVNRELRAFAVTHVNVCIQVGQIELQGCKTKYWLQISKTVKIATVLLFAGAIAKAWTSESTTMLGILSFVAVVWALLKANYIWGRKLSLPQVLDYVLFSPTIRQLVKRVESGHGEFGDGGHGNGSFPELFIGAIGYIFGDIGTSPLYVMRAALSHEEITQFNVFGVVSLVVWTITITVTIKYVFIMLQVDFNGEGGTPAQLRMLDKKGISKLFFFLGMFAIALLIGDAFITPAISVSSAVEGLKEVNDGLEAYVTPIICVIIFLLFFIQQFGTSKISKIFGPIMIIWFGMIGIFGLIAIGDNTEIWNALFPVHGIKYAFYVLETKGFEGFSELLGAIVLAATGGEAIYADLAHFSKTSIRASWFFVTKPALILNYVGQGAALLTHPENKVNPFYGVFPQEFVPVAVIVATLATVIASQALIGGVYSLVKQLMVRGNLPTFAIVTPDRNKPGQIYVPFANKVQYIGVMVTIAIFQNSTNMEAAYGLAVCGTMLITTLLYMLVLQKKYHMPLGLAFAITSVFFAFDTMFFASNLQKITHGGWYPLTIGGVLGLVLWVGYNPKRAEISYSH